MSGTNYFSYFPQMDYVNDGNTKTVVNIFKRAKMASLSSTIRTTIFYEYTIRDGERVEDIAHRYYGDTQYYWVILYTNNIANVYSQWPKSNQQLIDYLVSIYGSIEDSTATHHYEDSNGNWISYDAWVINGRNEECVKSIYDYEYEENEKKREIFIVRKEYLHQIIREMNNLFNING